MSGRRRPSDGHRDLAIGYRSIPFQNETDFQLGFKLITG
jgi:hypothetical protein